MTLPGLKGKIEIQLQKIKGNCAFAFKNLSNSSEIILINETEKFHAASTMKTLVMVEVFKQAEEGKFKLTDTIPVRNEFKSIADGSSFQLDIDRDGCESLYKAIDKEITIYDLLYEMITVSSNLAANLLIELVDAKNITGTMRELGARNIQIIRGVEDMKAYDLGLNNILTALDLVIVFENIVCGKAVSRKAGEQMIRILSDQKFNDIIPALLPKEIKVAHKTGSFEGVRHDSGILFLPDGRKYILVLLSNNLEDSSDAINVMANISKTIYDYMKIN